MSHTGVRSTSSPLAERMRMSLSPGGDDSVDDVVDADSTALMESAVLTFWWRVGVNPDDSVANDARANIETSVEENLMLAHK